MPEYQSTEGNSFGIGMTLLAVLTHVVSTVVDNITAHYELYFQLGTIFCLMCASFFWIVKFIKFFLPLFKRLSKFFRSLWK